MIPIISGFRWVPPLAQGYVRDHRVRWALEEIGRPYEVMEVDRAILDSKEYRAWHPFGQVPAYRDGEVELFESGAIVLHIAKTSEALAPSDPLGFDRVTAWVFAALSSVEPHVQNFANLDAFHKGEPWVQGYRPIAEARLRSRLEALNVSLKSKDYLEHRFTVADIIMSTVLRELSESGMLSDYAAVETYLRRCEDRPAFRRAIEAQLKGYLANAPA